MAIEIVVVGKALDVSGLGTDGALIYPVPPFLGHQEVTIEFQLGAKNKAIGRPWLLSLHSSHLRTPLESEESHSTHLHLIDHHLCEIRELLIHCI